MTQISQTSMRTGHGMNAIPVFTDAQSVNISANDFVWKVNGVVPTLITGTPKPYTSTEITGIPRLIPFKLKVSAGCYLNVILDGQDPEGSGTMMYFAEGENNQMVIKVLNDVANTLDGSTVDGDIVAYR